MSRLFRFHNYSPFEKVYAAMLFVAGLSLRDISERYCLTSASRESVRDWVHRLRQLFTPERRCRRLVAVNETVEKFSGQTVYIWSAVDVDSGGLLALEASYGRSCLNALLFIKKALRLCLNRPRIMVGRDP
ncbi:MAG: hypothetical protein QXM16_06715 [Nitrososphaerota archaeon]